jgi:glycosyltransferase involved in cell wall biosynthesis
VKPTLLYLSPTFPALSGHGGAMRACIFAEAFAHIYDISLVVVNLWDRAKWVEPVLASTFKSIRVFSIAELEMLRRTGKTLPINELDVRHIHACQLHIVSFMRSYLDLPCNKRPFLTLDLNDYESKLNASMATFCGDRGDKGLAKMLALRATKFAEMESAYLRHFDQVYVCHASDQEEISKTYGCNNIRVVPNAVRAPPLIRSSRLLRKPALLFVGTLDYYPNEDAITWFCTDILPFIRQMEQAAFEVLVVGSRPSVRVKQLGSAHQDVRIIGEVPELARYYDESVICIVPIRVGGGTRLKILEAMSYGKPVVATSIGAEGLDIKHGENILIGDSASEFARHCVDLIHDVGKRNRIGTNGCNWVRIHHLVKQSVETIHGLMREPKEIVSKAIDCHVLDIPQSSKRA